MQHLLTRTFRILSFPPIAEILDGLKKLPTMTFWSVDYVFKASEQEADDPDAQRNDGTTQTDMIFIYRVTIDHAEFIEPEDMGNNLTLEGFLDGDEPGSRSLVIINLSSNGTSYITFNPDPDHPELKID